MYEWHEKKYYGAAHGVIGILFVLLQAGEKYFTEDILENYIKASIDYLVSKQYQSGNMPSSHGSPNDRLIHWCHGAPGAIHLFLQAYNGVKFKFCVRFFKFYILNVNSLQDCDNVIPCQVLTYRPGMGHT